MVGSRLNRTQVAVGLVLGSSGETECLAGDRGDALVGKPIFFIEIRYTDRPLMAESRQSS